MTNKNGLNVFGKSLIEEVQDRAINDVSATLDGSSKAPANIKFRKKLLSRLDKKDFDLLKEVSVLSIQQVLFQLMVFIEEHNETSGVENIAPKLQLLIEEDDTLKDIVPLSDGLSGEYIGWVWDHSKFQDPTD